MSSYLNNAIIFFLLMFFINTGKYLILCILQFFLQTSWRHGTHSPKQKGTPQMHKQFSQFWSWNPKQITRETHNIYGQNECCPRKNSATTFQPQEFTGTKAAVLSPEDKNRHWYFLSQVHTQLQEQRGPCVLCVSENISCVQVELALFAVHIHRKLRAPGCCPESPALHTQHKWEAPKGSQASHHNMAENRLNTIHQN